MVNLKKPQARIYHETGGAAAPPQIFAKVDLLPIDNVVKSKKIAKKNIN